MVVSKLDKSISYPEIKSIMADDRESTAELYSIEVRGKDVVAAIGKQINTYIQKHIVYHPLYMIKNTGKAVQIGVYELHDTDVISMADENGNLDFERLGPPLTYTFANTNYIETNRMLPPGEKNTPAKPETETETETEPDNMSTRNTPPITNTLKRHSPSPSISTIPAIRSDIFSLDVNANPPLDLTEETSTDADRERNAFAKSNIQSASWIQKAMDNNNYNLIQTETNANSLFEAIQLAFAQLGQITSVSALRKKLSREVDQALFDKYTAIYRDSAQILLAEQKKAKLLETEYEKYKNLVTNTISANEQAEYIQNAKIIAKQHSDANNQKRNAHDIYNEVKFMKGIDTLEKLIASVQSNDYWPDEWAISTIERILNIKLVILSREHAKAEPDNILQCGSSIDAKLQSNGTFTPEFYILLENNARTYSLCTYKNKYIFKYKEIPYDIKNMIVTKCIERNSGPFILIPEFRTLSEVIDKNSLKGQEQIINIDMLTSTDPSVVFQFYDKSTDKPPGKGSGEKIEPEERRLEFAKLSPKGEYPNWRRKLDNTWVDTQYTIALDQYHWNSVEHYVQANKFKNQDTNFYFQFTHESGSELSKNVEMAIAAGSKNGKKGSTKIRPDNVQIDPTFQGKNENIARIKAMTFKFKEIPHYKGLLRATKNATLNKYVKGYPPKLDEDLIKIRNSIA